MDFIQCVKKRLEELDLKPSAAEREFNLPADTIRNLLRSGKNTERFNAGPTLYKTKEICDALGLELYFGPPRQKPTATGFAEAAQMMLQSGIDGSPEALRAGFLPIPFHADDPDHRGVGPVAFSRAWLKHRGLVPDGLSFMMARGDAMGPLARNGALLLVDGAGQIGPVGLPAIAMDGRDPVFAYLSRPSRDTLLATFADAGLPPRLYGAPNTQPVPRILGRVVWIGGETGPVST